MAALLVLQTFVAQICEDSKWFRCKSMGFSLCGMLVVLVTKVLGKNRDSHRLFFSGSISAEHKNSVASFDCIRDSSFIPIKSSPLLKEHFSCLLEQFFVCKMGKNHSTECKSCYEVAFWMLASEEWIQASPKYKCKCCLGSASNVPNFRPSVSLTLLILHSRFVQAQAKVETFSTIVYPSSSLSFRVWGHFELQVLTDILYFYISTILSPQTLSFYKLCNCPVIRWFLLEMLCRVDEDECVCSWKVLAPNMLLVYSLLPFTKFEVRRLCC